MFTAEETVPFDDDVWELYGETDWTQTRNLAAEMPGKLYELQRLWLIEATKHNVLPLDDRVLERFNADMAGRPQLVSLTSQPPRPRHRQTREESGPVLQGTG